MNYIIIKVCKGVFDRQFQTRVYLIFPAGFFKHSFFHIKSAMVIELRNLKFIKKIVLLTI